MTEAERATRDRSWVRLDGVDILRGLAIFFVLMNHVNMRLFIAHVPYTRGTPDQLAASLVWNGQYGVQMFFAVSGFLITSTTLRRWGALSGIGVRDFYLLRFARIAPLLLLLLAMLSALHAAGLRDFVVSAKTGGLGRALLAALTFHVNLLEAQRGYLPGSWDVLWSLSVEEMFYCTRMSHRNSALPDSVSPLRTPVGRCLWDGIADIQPVLLDPRRRLGSRPQRRRYDDSGDRHLHGHRRSGGDPVEEPLRHASSPIARPAQLRSLFDAHVRRLRAV